MRRFIPSRPMAVALLALCLALSGVAAAQPAAHGAKSLAATVKQALKLAKSANARSKRALSKAHVGPQGAQGLQGLAGAAGPTGPAPGFAGSASGVQTQTSPGQDIVSVAVPAGTYAVDATLSVQNESPSNTSSITHCTLSGGTGSDDSQLGLLGPSGGPLDRGSMGLSMSTVLSSAGSIVLHCTGEGGTGLTFLNTAHLEAVQVTG